jgi:hypothetical protein
MAEINLERATREVAEHDTQRVPQLAEDEVVVVAGVDVDALERELARRAARRAKMQPRFRA